MSTTTRVPPVVTPGRAPTVEVGVARFVALAFGISWAAWGLALAVDGPLAGTARAAGTFGPSVAAVAVLARAGGLPAVRRALGLLVRVRGAAGVAVTAALLPLAVAVAAIGIDRALGGATPIELPPWWVLPVVIGYVLVLGGPLGEELGWRGLLLPRLESRWRPMTATLIGGVVWFAWHLPLFLLPGSAQASVPLWLFAAQIVITSVVYTWLVHLTPHSLAPVLAFHTSFNVTVGVVLLPPPGAPTDRPLLIALAITAVLAVLLARTPTFRGGDRTRPTPDEEGAAHADQDHATT